MEFIELFAGVGGFRLGISQAIPDAKCVYSNEWDKHAAQTYDKNYKGEQIDQSDITTVKARDIPAHDCLVGGFPCQAFSIAGKRRGFDETRGTLFFEIARLLSHHRPRHLVLENVKGLLSHDNGKTFTTILGVLADLGYDSEWQVFNSKDFGVPQNRERVFIIGHLREQCGRKILPISGTNEVRTKPHASKEKVYSGTLTARQFASWGGNYIAVPENTKLGFAIARDGDSVNMRHQASKTRRGRVGKGIANTLDTGEPQAVFNGNRLRQLTPIECERLQGFPDNWTEGVSDTQRYKQMGNAVTVNVIKAIFERLDKICLTTQ